MTCSVKSDYIVLMKYEYKSVTSEKLSIKLRENMKAFRLNKFILVAIK